jgi:hypothetical protein
MQGKKIKFFTSNQFFTLGKKLGEGGEGTVFCVDENSSLIVKLYHDATKFPLHKLKAMIANPPHDTMQNQGHNSICWPIDLVELNGHLTGYVMPLAGGANKKCFPLNTIYSVKSRCKVLPDFTFKDLLLTASNVALVVHAIHESGYVIGDVNESNFLVTDEALVSIVDTDSFQVISQNGKVNRCPVGKPEFTPPELQGVRFSEVDRSPLHDRFGLSVLIFMILMGGIHPFESMYKGNGAPPSRNEKIKKGYFSYSGKYAEFQPLSLLPFSILSIELQKLFLDCFDTGHTDLNYRPSAWTWYSKLCEASEDANLLTCHINSQHIYPKHLFTCPWCSYKNSNKIDPFPSLRKLNSARAIPLQRKRSSKSNPNSKVVPISPSVHLRPHTSGVPPTSFTRGQLPQQLSTLLSSFQDLKNLIKLKVANTFNNFNKKNIILGLFFIIVISTISTMNKSPKQNSNPPIASNTTPQELSASQSQTFENLPTVNQLPLTEGINIEKLNQMLDVKNEVILKHTLILVASKDSKLSPSFYTLFIAFEREELLRIIQRMRINAEGLPYSFDDDGKEVYIKPVPDNYRYLDKGANEGIFDMALSKANNPNGYNPGGLTVFSISDSSDSELYLSSHLVLVAFQNPNPIFNNNNGLKSFESSQTSVSLSEINTKPLEEGINVTKLSNSLNVKNALEYGFRSDNVLVIVSPPSPGLAPSFYTLSRPVTTEKMYRMIQKMEVNDKGIPVTKDDEGNIVTLKSSPYSRDLLIGAESGIFDGALMSANQPDGKNPDGITLFYGSYEGNYGSPIHIICFKNPKNKSEINTKPLEEGINVTKLSNSLNVKNALEYGFRSDNVLVIVSPPSPGLAPSFYTLSRPVTTEKMYRMIQKMEVNDKGIPVTKDDEGNIVTLKSSPYSRDLLIGAESGIFDGALMSANQPDGKNPDGITLFYGSYEGNYGSPIHIICFKNPKNKS